MNIIEELERLDRFYDGEEDGEVPIEVLRARGFVIPPDDSLDDQTLHTKLWELIHAMFSIGMVIEFTDHLSDRELYRYLVNDQLLQPTILSEGGFWHLSPIGGGSEEDNEIWLRYYADDEDREDWKRDFEEILPPKERPPHDRDRLLPGR